MYVGVPPGPNPPGTYVASSTVYVFDTARGAADYFAESREQEPDPTATSRAGLTIEEIKLFDAAVADEAIGFHSNGPIDIPDGTSYRAYTSGLEFRRGRLVATVGFVSLEELDNDEYLKSLARMLDERIAEVLQAQAQPEAGGVKHPEPLVMRPGAVLATSAERFTQQVETYQGTFDMTMAMGDFHMATKGEFAFRAPDTMYMTMGIMGQTMEMLMVAPDMYMRTPGEGWYVMTAESMGMNREVFEEWAESQGPTDYWSTVQQLDGLTRLPDEVQDGVTYLRYEGTLDMAEALEDIPEGLYEPGVREQVEDVLQPVKMELWLDKETYLPQREEMEMTFTVEGTSFSIDMSVEYFGYNEPVDIPEPPVDAEPLHLGDGAGL